MSDPFNDQLAQRVEPNGAISPLQRRKQVAAEVANGAGTFASSLTVIGFFNATPVVQPSAVADATDAASVITQLNALLSRMRNLGLIAV